MVAQASDNRLFCLVGTGAVSPNQDLFHPYSSPVNFFPAIPVPSIARLKEPHYSVKLEVAQHRSNKARLTRQVRVNPCRECFSTKKGKLWSQQRPFANDRQNLTLLPVVASFLLNLSRWLLGPRTIPAESFWRDELSGVCVTSFRSNDYGGTACKFCRLHRGGGWQSWFVEPTKLTHYSSVETASPATAGARLYLPRFPPNFK